MFSRLPTEGIPAKSERLPRLGSKPGLKLAFKTGERVKRKKTSTLSDNVYRWASAVGGNLPTHASSIEFRQRQKAPSSKMNAEILFTFMCSPPRRCRRRFSGLISRCAIPRWCRNTKASSTCMMIFGQPGQTPRRETGTVNKNRPSAEQKHEGYFTPANNTHLPQVCSATRTGNNVRWPEVLPVLHTRERNAHRGPRELEPRWKCRPFQRETAQCRGLPKLPGG